MFEYENLLRNEYFPAELPPCFNTESLADNFDKVKQIFPEIHYNGTSESMTFSGYKNVNARRKFAIPNPFHYCKAIEVIVNNSESIFNILNKSKASLTRPLKNPPQRNESYRKPTHSIEESKHIIEQLYQNNLFEIRLDIASFFDSIYTHSVPWAIHTKQVAKRNKTDALFGNVLDSSLQSMNYGQTNGVLVGNAVSRIVSEIILCVVDEAIQKRLPNITFKRYVDDYYIYTKSSLEINNIVAVFRQELAKYELTLNENKIQIYESPFIYGKPWVEQMKEYLHLKPDVFLSKMIMGYNNYKDISILKYGLKVIQFQKYSAIEWKNIQSILINIWVKFPSLSNIFIAIFKCNEDLVSKLLMKKAIYSILENNLNLKNDQEVIWAIWASKVFSIEMSQPYIEKVLISGNWLANIIMLDIIKSSNIKNRPTIKGYLNNLYDEIVEEFSNEDSNSHNLMWTEIWLLAYEADRNKWLNLSGEKCFMFARKNDFFKKLRELNIKFYDSEYNYIVRQPKIKKNNYVTRQEFNEVMKKLQESINSRSDDSDNIDFELTVEERDLIDTIHSVVSVEDY